MGQFDPTPFAGQPSGSGAGVVAQFNKYVEALETIGSNILSRMTIRARNRFVRSVRRGFVDFQAKSSTWLAAPRRVLDDWWKEVRGDKGLRTSLSLSGTGRVCGGGVGYLFRYFGFTESCGTGDMAELACLAAKKERKSIVEFYERMQNLLARRGFRRAPHQTPLEFAFALDMPEAVKITEKYNRVRFGDKSLSRDETREIEDWLKDLESKPADKL